MENSEVNLTAKLRCRKIAIICTTAAVIIFLSCIWLFYCPNFSVDRYQHRMDFYERTIDGEIITVSPIDSKLDALKANDEFWRNNSPVNKLHTNWVYYDQAHDCWLILGLQTDVLIYDIIYQFSGVSGGDRGAIISSDGTVLAAWIGM